MNRKHFLRSTALVAGGSLFFRDSVFASWFPAPAGTIRMLRGNVGIFTERGGTIGFHLDPKGISVIDAQFPDTAAHFIEEVRKQQEGSAFHLLLNTHHHGDHTAGNIAFKDLVPHVLAHANAAANQKAVAEKAGKLDQQLLPDTTFDTEAKVKRDKEKISGHYFGTGHTNGDAVYHFEEANIAHVGDLVFNRRHPVVDRNYGASIVHWVEVLDAIGKKFDKDTLFIFGHAAEGYEVTGTRDDVAAFRAYLQRLIAFAQGEIKAGKTKEEFTKNMTIPGETEWKGGGIERPLAAIWDELTAEKR
jgi:cyclase